MLVSRRLLTRLFQYRHAGPMSSEETAGAVPSVSSVPSARKADLLELAYQYVLEHGLAELSLRPLAKAIGSSPRVLLYLFGSKDGLVRALLGRARVDELGMLAAMRRSGQPEGGPAAGGAQPGQFEDGGPAAGEPGNGGPAAGDGAGGPVPAGEDLAVVAAQLWDWLVAKDHRALLTLWVEGYSRSLTDPSGPWAGFAQATVRDWLDLLRTAQPPAGRDGAAAQASRTLVLAVLRGALLDLLATGDTDRITPAVHQQLQALADPAPAVRAG
jgi:AcrR family transcriptional regulator